MLRLLDSPPKRIAALALLGFAAALVAGSLWMAMDGRFRWHRYSGDWLEAAFDPSPRWFETYAWLVRYGLWGSVASVAFILLFDHGRAAYLRLRAWVQGA